MTDKQSQGLQDMLRLIFIALCTTSGGIIGGLLGLSATISRCLP